MSIEVLGYLAIAVGLIAMSCKEIIWLRSIHSISALIYIVYGSMIEALPIVVGGSVFLLIHMYHLARRILVK